MSNPLMNAFRPAQNTNLSSAMQIMNLLRSGNPNQMLNQMISNNPQFRDFYEKNKNKSVEQIASDYGVDIGMVRNILGHK